MKRKIGLQLYTLRAEVKEKGMAAILKEVKEMGYSEVEPAGFGDLTAKEFATACADNGLTICSAHSVKYESVSEAVDILGTLGLKWLCIGYGKDAFKDLDSIKAAAEKSNEVIDKFEANGISVFQHNHYWEYALLDGRIKYDYYLDLCPKVKLELDIFWAANFGANDAVRIVKRYRDRMVYLHLKDGMFPANPDAQTIDMRPLGEGQLDIPGIAANLPENIAQIIVELDYSNIDMTESVRRSHDYLVRVGVGC